MLDLFSISNSLPFIDPRKDKLSLGMKVDDGPLTQTRVTFTIKPTDNSAMAKDIHNTHRHELKETSGKLTYKAVGEGKVKICVKIDEIPGRRYIKPALIGFRIKESGELDDLGDGVASADKKDQDAAKSHMSEMERILNKMIKDVNLLLKNADLIKDDEAGFHRQSDEMNSAAKWWPMMHICVLLVTGFTQANHVVKFFKGKHII